MNKTEEISLAISRAGLVNDPKVCIKNYGSSFACVCKDCMEERDREIQKELDLYSSKQHE